MTALVEHIKDGFERLTAEVKSHEQRFEFSRGSIIGTGSIGSTYLSVLPTGAVSANRQWTLDGVAIAGQTAETYLATPESEGKALDCRLTNIVWTSGAVQVPVSSRILEITTIYGGRTAPVPQKYYDGTAAEAVDPLTHPPIGASTHFAVKSGNWSDPTVWSTGTIPNANAIVRTMTHTVIYDLESDVKIKDLCVCTGGTFKFATDRDTRLWVDTIQAHGPFIQGDVNDPILNSTTPVKPRSEIVFWQSEAPLATTRLGLVTMAPVRVHGHKKASRLTCNGDMLVGATQITLEGVAQSGWRIGDKILIVATSYAGTSATDPQYTGPTSGYLPVESVYAVRTNTNGFYKSHDEIRTITDINGNVVTIDVGLTYNHLKYSDVLPQGDVVVVKPMVAMISQSIRWRSEVTTPRQKRAHSMFMHCDDVDVRYVEALNMGRTDLDLSLVVPDGGPLIRATNGGTNLADPTNVRGRYPFHVHKTGPYLGRRQVILKGCTSWAPTAEVPIPGWGMTHHSSRAAFEDCVIYNVRGAGMVSELGDEIGQWMNNTVAWVRGDGFARSWQSRAEFYANHNGHDGVAYECQARQVLCQGNHFASCQFAWVYQQQTESQDQVVPGPNTANRVTQDVSLRLYDPIAQGGRESLFIGDDDTYGLRQAQIPDWHDNGGWAARVGFFVAHRGPGSEDTTPMLSKRFHCVNVKTPWWVMNYSNSYLFKDFFWNGGDVAASQGNSTWRMNFANFKIKNFTVGFDDPNGLGINYEGNYIDGAFENVTTPFAVKWYGFGNYDCAVHPQNGSMGPWVIDPQNPRRAIVRQLAVINSYTDLPTPYPLAPYGLKLPAGFPAVPVGGTPYFVLGDGTSTAGIDTTVVAGLVKKQLSIYGVIRDSVGDRRFGDFQLVETDVASIPVRGPRTAYNMTGEQMIERNGCFNDTGTWKTRLWFTDINRSARSIEGHPDYFSYHVDCTLTGFGANFLIAHTVNPNIPPKTPIKPEIVEPAKPLVADLTAPSITSSLVINQKENAPLAHILKANDVHPWFAISGGADAARFEVHRADGRAYLRFVGNATPDFEAPTDIGANNVYEVGVTVRDDAGNVSAAFMHTVTIEDEYDAIVSPFTDNFNRATSNLEATIFWTRKGGFAGILGVNANRVRNTATQATDFSLYQAPRTGSNNHYAQFATEASYASIGMAVCASDENNCIMIRQVTDQHIEIKKRVGGVESGIAFFGGAAFYSAGAILRAEYNATTAQLILKKNGTVIDTRTIASPPPATDRVGLYAFGSGNNGMQVDNFESGAL